MLYQLLNKLKVNDAIHFQLTLWLHENYYSVKDVKYRDMMIYDNINWEFWEQTLASSEFHEEVYKWNQEVDKNRKVTLPEKRKSPD